MLEYCSGSTAGTPLSDIIFTVSFVVVLKSACKNLKAAGLVTTLTDIPMVWPEGWQNSQLDIVEMSYCDDTAYPIVSSAETIEAKARQTIEIIAFSFYRFGFTLNYGRAKTEVLFEFRRKGANAARKNIEQTMKLQVTIPVGRIVEITVGVMPPFFNFDVLG